MGICGGADELLLAVDDGGRATDAVDPVGCILCRFASEMVVFGGREEAEYVGTFRVLQDSNGGELVEVDLAVNFVFLLVFVGRKTVAAEDKPATFPVLENPSINRVKGGGGGRVGRNWWQYLCLAVSFIQPTTFDNFVHLEGPVLFNYDRSSVNPHAQLRWLLSLGERVGHHGGWGRNRREDFGRRHDY